MVAPKKKVSPKKLAPKKTSAGASYRQSLRERTAASNAFARRDADPQWSNGEGSKRVKGKVKPGEYIPLYNDVTPIYKAIKKYGHEGRGGGDFPMGEAKANTFKGKQYLKNTGGTLSSNYSVKAGTIAGPKTLRNESDMAKFKEMNAKRDARNKALRRGRGKGK